MDTPMHYFMPGASTAYGTGHVKLEPRPSVDEYDDIPSLDDIPGMKTVPYTERAVCEVCGDKSSGFHYNVISCNGCKTFFRRTVIMERKFSCKHGGKCVFDKEARCACRACRFKKCLEVGMRPDGIQKVKNRERFVSGSMDEYNSTVLESQKQRPVTIKKEVEDEDWSLPSTASNSPVLLQSPTMSPEYRELARELKELTHREDRLDALRARYNGFYVSGDTWEMLQQPSLFGERAERSHYLLSTPGECEFLRREQPEKYWIISELALEVEYMRSFPFFASLPIKDQHTLATHGASLMSLVALGVSAIRNGSETTVFHDGRNAADTYCSRPTRFPGLFDRLYRNPATLLRSLAPNERLIALIKMIHLYDPTVDGLSPDAAEAIALERERYMGILLRYVFCEKGLSAPSYLPQVLQSIGKIYGDICKAHDLLSICTNTGFHPLNVDAIDATNRCKGAHSAHQITTTTRLYPHSEM